VALSTTYVARETAGNLRRNLVMTVAAMVTMTVSLSVLGVVLIVRQAANKATEQWRGGVEMAIFLQPTVTTTQSGAIGRELATNPGVKNYHFVDKTEAYQEFKTIFGGNSEIVSSLGPSDMPPSYRVVPTKAQDIQDLGKQFTNQPGVLQVSYAAQAIKALLNRSNQIKVGGQVLAALVMLAAVALIVNTIQLAIFARRREVAVMKLVGATNWFIRVPFMLEGLVQGLVGAALAFGLIYAIRNPVASFVGNESMLGIQTLYVAPREAVLTGILLLVVGAAVGMVGSAFAVRRFLSV
jgi:cell division transport system permease protein